MELLPPAVYQSGENWPDTLAWIIQGQTIRSGQNPKNWIIPVNVATRSGLDHPGQNKKERPQPPGLDHPWKGGRIPLTGSSGAERAAGVTAPRTGPSGEQGRPDALDWILRG